MDVKKLNNELGNADLILIDQILKDRFNHHMRILDAGCGEGRNMVYFVKNDFKIYGIDKNAEAVNMAKIVCRSSNENYELENIQNFTIEDNPFPDQFFDAVLCINVLHSARDRQEFFNLLDHLQRLVTIGGFLFLSMESKIGFSSESHKIKNPCEDDLHDEQNFYYSAELRSEIIANDQIMEIEPARTILIDDIKSNTYLFLRKIG
jgi:2-polyprenyl-3-methyl-5-hydroxy-6-metoxy-1,4-benzoquinol methylase